MTGTLIVIGFFTIVAFALSCMFYGMGDVRGRKYRITKRDGGWYKIEVRVWGFFWVRYDPSGYGYAKYATLEEAKDEVKMLTKRRVKTIIESE